MYYANDVRATREERKMGHYKTKYSIGDKVETGGVPGLITAIHIRKGHRAYEFSYSNDGQPASCTCEEVELTETNESSLGFK